MCTIAAEIGANGMNGMGMIDSSEMIHGIAVCDMCGGLLGRARYVQAEEASLYVFCSVRCVRNAEREQSMERWAARRRNAKRLAIVIILLGGLLTPHQGPQGPLRVEPVTPVKSANVPGLAPLPPGWFGPNWPPTEMSLLAALGRDAWVHPLSGPVRRMPRTDSRVFGAVRPGDRAIECRNGHCGVDLGGEIWGEHVRAVHDGVVDWVQRGANPDHGGRFVRLSHRGGTLFSQYFHLAAIPRALERGMPVKGGDVIGLLGDTGVKESAPHLHFTISIRPSKDWYEKYIDPEPLIALWPLRVPLDGSEVGLVTTTGQPGVPLGSAPLKPGRKKKLTKQKRAPDESAKSEGKRPADPDAIPTEEDTTSEPETTSEPRFDD
jgi:murein DD-endopeptidase MepM/ murein hydrolase activator NlpD